MPRTLTLTDEQVGDLSDALDEYIEMIAENRGDDMLEEEIADATELLTRLIALANMLTPDRIKAELYLDQ